MPVPTGLDSCHALFLYEGAVRQLVTNLKYRNDRRLVGWLVRAMATVVTPAPGAVVTWVPTTPERRRRRGFDQAALLARALARRWKVPCLEALHRHPGTPQTGRTLAERQAGIDLEATSRSPLLRRPVVLVDDVVTTGSTLRDAASALRAAGAQRIDAVTVARTPRSH